MEIWIDIVGYEGLYRVSNCGNIYSLTSCQYRKFQIDKDGYSVVLLSKDGVKKHHKVHRLVGIHFVDNINNLPCINHIDGDKSNNHYINLEWCTWLDNNMHKISMYNLIEYNGEYKTLPQWAKHIGVGKTTLRSRIMSGMTFEQAMTHVKGTSYS